VPLIEMKVIEGTTSEDEKRELIERLTDAVIAVKGEPLRPHIWVLITDVQSRAWGAGGNPVSSDDVNALLAAQ
jgi:4-oxalocrotonate tautomerase